MVSFFKKLIIVILLMIFYLIVFTSIFIFMFDEVENFFKYFIDPRQWVLSFFASILTFENTTN